jgi:hypothetical protein
MDRALATLCWLSEKLWREGSSGVRRKRGAMSLGGPTMLSMDILVRVGI